jgi:hypothetical protein
VRALFGGRRCGGGRPAVGGGAQKGAAARGGGRGPHAVQLATGCGVRRGGPRDKPWSGDDAAHGLRKKLQGEPSTEINMTHVVLIGMQNRTFGRSLVACASWGVCATCSFGWTGLGFCLAFTLCPCVPDEQGVGKWASSCVLQLLRDKDMRDMAFDLAQEGVGGQLLMRHLSLFIKACLAVEDSDPAAASARVGLGLEVRCSRVGLGGCALIWNAGQCGGRDAEWFAIVFLEEGGFWNEKRPCRSREAANVHY